MFGLDSCDSAKRLIEVCPRVALSLHKFDILAIILLKNRHPGINVKDEWWLSASTKLCEILYACLGERIGEGFA